MSRRVTRLLLLLPTLLLPGSTPTSPFAPTADPRHVHLEFVISPHADYLYYVFTRSPTRYPNLEERVPLNGVPVLSQLIALPEIVAGSRVRDYAGLYTLAEPYRAASLVGEGPPRVRLGFGSELPSYDAIMEAMSAAEPHYPAFLEYWRSEIEPAERAQLEAWRAQADVCPPLDTLQRWARLPFPVDTLRVGALALHPAGSAVSHPAGVYSSLQRQPRLAWLLGHEATHLLVGDLIGAAWRDEPHAAAVVRSFESRGGSAAQMEEVLAVFMQVTLAQACGQYDATVRFSDTVHEESPMRALLVALEDRWPLHLADPTSTLVDLLLAAAQQEAGGF